MEIPNINHYIVEISNVNHCILGTPNVNNYIAGIRFINHCIVGIPNINHCDVAKPNFSQCIVRINRLWFRCSWLVGWNLELVFQRRLVGVEYSSSAENVVITYRCTPTACVKRAQNQTFTVLVARTMFYASWPPPLIGNHALTIN